MTMQSTRQVRRAPLNAPAGEPPLRTLVSRRTFAEGAVAIAAAGAALSMPALARAMLSPAVREHPAHAAGASQTAFAGAAAGHTPVVSFYMDRPYLDWTGTAEPYISPAGSRSGQPLAEVGDEAFFSRFPY